MKHMNQRRIHYWLSASYIGYATLIGCVIPDLKNRREESYVRKIRRHVASEAYEATIPLGLAGCMLRPS